MLMFYNEYLIFQLSKLNLLWAEQRQDRQGYLIQVAITPARQVPYTSLARSYLRHRL